MTCTEILERLLSADAAELAGGGDSAVAEHVRHCVRCRAVAERLMLETSALALAMAERGAHVRVRHPRRPVPGLTLAPLFAMAVLAMVLWRSGIESVTRHVPVPATARLATPATTDSEVVPAAATVSRATAESAKPRIVAAQSRRSARPIGARAYPAAQAFAVSAVQPTRVEVGVSDRSLGAELSVTPAAGGRAVVMRTSNPAVTVVWLY